MARLSSRSTVPVVLAGLATTAATLIGLFVLGATYEDVNVMGWYVNYVIPAGALLAGLVASSGYGIASWKTGVKITHSLLWTVLGLQFIAYFAAQYLEYRTLNPILQHVYGFWAYFNLATQSLAWQGEHGGEAGSPFGIWGYGIRFLEIAGFGLGSLIVPAALRTVPYCPECQVYMRTRTLATIPAGIKLRKIKKNDADDLAAYETEREAAEREGEAIRSQTVELAERGDAFTFETVVREIDKHRKEALKVPRRFAVELVSCPSCRNGSIRTARIVVVGDRADRTAVSETPVTPEFVRVVGGKA